MHFLRGLLYGHAAFGVRTKVVQHRGALLLEFLDQASASHSVARQQAAYQMGVSDCQRQLRAAGSFPPALGAVLGVVSEVASLAECRQVEQPASLRPLVVHVGGGQNHDRPGIFAEV